MSALENPLEHPTAPPMPIPADPLAQLLAALLDRLAPLPGSERRLVEVTEQLVEFDYISRESADATYEAALYLPLASIAG